MAGFFVMAGLGGMGPGASAQHLPSAVQYDSSAVTVRTPNAETLQRYRTDPDFDYDRNQAAGPSWWERLWHWFQDHVLRPLFAEELSPLRRIVFYGAVAAILIFAALRLLRMHPRAAFSHRDTGVQGTLTEVEDDIQAPDFDRLIEVAIADRAYRRAVRLLYLQTLQRLATRGLINWRPETTNREYVEAITEGEMRVRFAELTRQFEYIWYGDMPVDEPLFERIQRAFAAFRQQFDRPQS